MVLKKGKSVLMIAYTEYVADGRVIREAEAALSGGFQVDVISLTWAGARGNDNLRGVQLQNVSQYRYRGGGLLKYALSYLEFFLRTFFKATFLHLKNRYVAVHVHNMPDFFVFCALIPKLMGAKILLDIHDPMAETFASKFKSGKRGLMFRLLLWEEKLSAWFADRIITVHEPVKEHILVKHGHEPEMVEVIANFADEQIFRLQAPQPLNGKLRMVFHGSVLERYGLGDLVRAIAKSRYRDRLVVKIIGDGDFSTRLEELIRSLELSNVDFDKNMYPLHDIPELVAGYHLGLVPIEISEITDFILPLKLLEYISMGIPPITVRNTAIAHYFGEDDCFFYKPGDQQGLADLLDYIVENPAVLNQHREKALALRPKFLWSGQSQKYVTLLQGLS